MNIQNFKALFSKKYPAITKARKFWVLVIGIAMPLMVILIILNLTYSKGLAGKQSASSSSNSNVQQVATKQDTDWYQNTTPPLPVPDFNGKPVSKADLAKLRAMMLGKNIDNTSSNIGDDETQKAMKSPISTNQITNGDQGNLQNLQTNGLNNQDLSSTDSQNNPSQNLQLNSDDQNMQNEKQNFLNKNKINKEDYLGSSLQNPLSPYELQAGTVIPAVLITGINSDLPGQITAQVSENVYDSISGNNLLIPQGTKVVGVYDSKVAYGQERVLAAWKRLILPNGQSLDLSGMPGVDLSGYSGFNDEVDNHYGKIFGSVILMSIMGAGAQLSQPQNNNSPYGSPTVNQMIAQSMGTNIANVGTMIAQKNVNIQPTLNIRPGYQFNITATKDMVFPSSYRS